jgi:hypothetical protein
MKSFFAASILVLMFCVVSFAQTSENVPCPAISVTGPTGVVRPGDTVTFSLIIGKEVERYEVKYEWTISVGEIIEGQGTATIKAVQKPEDAGSNFTASIQVKGLPENCPADASETAAPYDPPHSIEVDEFSIPATQIEIARLKILANEAQNNPSARIYIIEIFKRKTSPKAIELKNQKTLNYLKMRGIERDFITLLNAFGDENITRFVLAPAGASPPNCDDCVTVQP